MFRPAARVLLALGALSAGAPAAHAAERVVLPAAGADAAVAAAGGRVLGRYGGLVEARLPTGSAVPGAREPLRPVTLGTPSAAVPRTNATALNAQGAQGQGVDVAIIDDGFRQWDERQRGGDLPATVTQRDFCGGGFAGPSGHGSAVAEAVHDMAPRARLHLLCVGTEVGLGQAKDYAKSAGIEVVVQAMGWPGSSRGDGSGGPATPEGIAADASAAGILWVNAAGNQAERHWGGTFLDADRDGWHEFTGSDEGNSFSNEAGYRICASLKWDAWPTTRRDYDLEIRNSATGEVVARSERRQSTTAQAPSEFVCVPQDTYAQQLELRIQDRGGTCAATCSPRLDLHLLRDSLMGGALQVVTAAGSLVEPAGSPAVLAVGAVCVADGVRETFSSQGPAIDGRVKPDLVAPDSALAGTSPYDLPGSCGYDGFAGTSAAAAHVAGAAALLASDRPGTTASQLATLLRERAVPRGTTPRPNAQFGSGELQVRAFPDLAASDPIAGHAEALSRPGIYRGDGTGRFAATASLTRGRFAALLLRAMGHAGHPTEHHGYFSDVPAGSADAAAIEHAHEHGLFPIGDGTFRPGAAVTRSDAVAWTTRSRGHAHNPPAAYRGSFTDVPSSEPNAQLIEHALAHGWIDRPADGTFRPADPLTSRDMVGLVARAFALRFFDRLEGDFGDVAFQGEVLYATERSRGVVVRYSLQTGAELPSIAVGSSPRGLDVAGGLLVVANAGSSDVSVVDLAGAREVRRIAVPPSSSGDVPFSVAGTATGRALLTTTYDGTGYGGRILEVDPKAGTSRLRTDLGGNAGRTSEATHLVASVDRKRVFAVVGDGSDGQLWAYDAATDKQVAATATGTFNGYLATDQTGARVVVGPQARAFDGSFGGSRLLGRDGFGVGMRPSTGEVYLTRDTGLEAVRFTDGLSYGVKPLGDAVSRALNSRYFLSPVGRMRVNAAGTVTAVITDGGISLMPTRR